MLAKFGPHNNDMTLHEWFEVTLRCLAHGKDEEEEFEAFIQILRKRFKVFDVATLQELTRLQLEQAATTAVGEQGRKGLANLVCKYLGAQGSPHLPPSEQESDAFACPNEVAKNQVQFGRVGKGGCNSTESNFPEAMLPSRRARTLKADELKLPIGLHEWMTMKCAPFNKEFRMPRDITTDITRTMGDWIISMFGCSPVRTRAPPPPLGLRVHPHVCLWWLHACRLPQ